MMQGDKVAYGLLKSFLLPVLTLLFRPKVRGLRNVPASGPVIIASNHLSFSDSIFMPLVVPRKVTFLAKSEYFTSPGIKGLAKKLTFIALGQVAVDRAGGSRSEAALLTGLSVLAEGGCLGIYPEGTRSPDGRLYRGRTGVARLAMESGAPVVPVAMFNTADIQPTGKVLPKIMRVKMIFGEPMYFQTPEKSQDPEELRKATDAIMNRLFYLQIADGPRYQEAALDIQSRDIVTPALRGLIVDHEGNALATNKAGLMVTADRSVLDKLEDKGVSVLTRVAEVLKLEYSDIYTRTRLCGELASGERNGCWNGNRYQPIPITKDASENQVFTILEKSDLFPGIDAKPVSIRSYPSLAGQKATHVLGYLGPITEKNLNNEEGKRYYRNELIGKAGIELLYDEQLRGVPGIRTVIVDRKEIVRQESLNRAPVPGNHLVLNLNAKLQAAVEVELKDAVFRARANGYRGDSGAAIVMDVKTGEVLAMASYPDYDLNIWENGITVNQARDLYSEKSGVPALSRAIQGEFAPASTFKVVSLSAAVDAGYSLKTTYECPAEVQIGDRTFKNFDSKAAGRISMTTAMAISCDSIWYQIAYDEWVRDGGLKPKPSPNDYFFDSARGFGVGKKTGVDLPSELSGRLPDRQWKLNWYEKNKDFYCNYTEKAKKSQLTPYLIEIARENCLDGDKVRAGDMVNFSIGQGDTLMTPLQLAVAYSALANGGKLMVPKVAKAIVEPSGRVVKEFKPEISGRLPIKKSTLKFLQNSLRAVVTSGTATGAFSGVGVEVSGKTGTGQVFGRNLDGSSKDDTSWFASFAPSKKPEYAVVMMVSQGGFGASTSGVGVRKIYEHIFGTNGRVAIFPNGTPKKLPRIDSAKVALP